MDTTAATAIKRMLILFLVFIALYFGKSFLIPLAIGGVLATLFLPFCRWMEARWVPPLAAASICLLTLLLFIGGIGAVVGWQIRELSGDIGMIKERFLETFAGIQQFILNHFGITLASQQKLFDDHQPAVANLIKDMAGSLTSLFTYSILVLVYVLLLLYYRGHIRQFLLKLSPPAKKDEMDMVVNSVARVSHHYLFGLSKMIICLWIMYGIGFSLLGVKNALFFAVLCGVLEIVPFIGNITGTIITLSVTAVQGGNTATLAGIVVVYGIIQFIQGWVLEPLIVGKQVKVNPLFTIIALVIGELLWGIPGVFLAIPLMAMLKIVCDNITSLKPYGFLIGETKERSKSPGFLKKLNALKKI